MYRWLTIVLAAALAAAAGCGGNDAAPVGVATDAEFMTDFKELLTDFHKQKRRWPSKAEELGPLEPTHPGAVRRVQQGTIVYSWGAAVGTSGQEVIAHEKAAAEKGGQVLLEDGTVKSMTAAEFAAAPKAAGKVGKK